MSEELTLVFILHEADRAEIRRIADVVSAPDSDAPHIERAALRSLVRLPDAERAAVIEWIQKSGMRHLDVRSMSGQTVFVQATAEQLAKVFGPESMDWIRAEDSSVVPPADWTIPRQLACYVQSVKLRHRGNRARSTMVGDAGAENPIRVDKLEGEQERGAHHLAGVTPKDIKKIYNFPDTWDGSGETIALLMLGGTVAESDLHEFWAANAIKPPTVKMIHVGSRPNPKSPASHNKLYLLEVAMTVEWAGAMAPGAKILVYFIDPTVIADPWATFLLKVLGDVDNAPTIACTSWITPERAYYRSHGRKVITGLLEQAAALGITVISAAGDWGAFDGVPRIMKDGLYVGDAPWPHGVFPAVEERVLAVGGTMVTSLRPLTEVAWSGPPPPGLGKLLHFTRVASSGGFSREVPAPAWQAAARRGWYARGDTEPAVIPYGRGFPDVSLMASGPAVQRRVNEPLSMQGYQAVVGGKWVDYAGGTSVAAPIWAAIIARMNQARRAAGMRRVGFVNPLLYALRKETPSPFRDVTQGNTDVAMNVVNMHGKAMTHRLPGFTAAPGWDPATGLGVPHVANLILHATKKLAKTST